MPFIAFKYRLYPTKEQQSTLERNFGAARWVFNHFLYENQRRYRDGEKYLNAFGCNYEITKLKKEPETSWLREVDDWCLKNSSTDLGNAYTNFWNSLKGKGRQKSKFPKFKKKEGHQSYRTMLSSKQNFESGFINLPKLKQIKFKYHRPIQGKMKSVTVSKTPSGKYFVSILCEVDSFKEYPKTGLEVGIDLGIKDLAIISSGLKFQHPEQILAKPKRQLKNAQRKLARKKKGSRRYNKQKLQVAKKFELVTNVRNAYYHTISSWLTESYDSIYLENLNVKGMLRNRRLSRKIHETAWSTLKGMILYKAAMRGKIVYEVDRFFASSKTCSCCGEKNKALSLGDREWACQNCGSIHDRDWNAAINILQEAQKNLYGQVITAVESTLVEQVIVPASLKKFATKIERSDQVDLLAEGPEKTMNLGSE